MCLATTKLYRERESDIRGIPFLVPFNSPGCNITHFLDSILRFYQAQMCVKYPLKS